MTFAGWYALMVGVLMIGQWGFFVGTFAVLLALTVVMPYLAAWGVIGWRTWV